MNHSVGVKLETICVLEESAIDRILNKGDATKAKLVKPCQYLTGLMCCDLKCYEAQAVDRERTSERITAAPLSSVTVMKQFVERDGAVEGEACVICAVPEFSGIHGSYSFSALEATKVHKAQGSDLLFPSPDYNLHDTVELSVCGLLCSREALNWFNWEIS